MVVKFATKVKRAVILSQGTGGCVFIVLYLKGENVKQILFEFVSLKQARPYC